MNQVPKFAYLLTFLHFQLALQRFFPLFRFLFSISLSPSPIQPPPLFNFFPSGPSINRSLLSHLPAIFFPSLFLLHRVSLLFVPSSGRDERGLVSSSLVRSNDLISKIFQPRALAGWRALSSGRRTASQSTSTLLRPL